MLRCISKDYPEGLIFHQSRASLYERKRLLAMLLAHRHALRVICAPALYGKSTLAYQYADRTFAPDEVQWVEASDPSFLIALDAPLPDEFSVRFLDRGSSVHKSSLFVFDGCPTLEDGRFELLRSCIADLLEAGHEVILTTSDVRWLEIDAPALDVIDARMLLLDRHEREHWFQDGSFDRDERVGAFAAEDELLFAIPGCRMNAHANVASFVDALLDRTIESEAEALSLLMVLLEEGALHELYTFVRSISDATLTAIAHHWPHAGMGLFDPMFHAIELDDDSRFVLACHHLGSLAHHLSGIGGEEALLDALVEAFMAHGRGALATRLVCGMRDDTKRAAFLDRQAASFLFDGHPRELLELARTLPRCFFIVPKRLMGVAFALGSLGEGQLAEWVIAKLEESGGRDEGSHEVIAALMRVLFGLADARKAADVEQLIASALERHRAGEANDHQNRPVLAGDLLEMLSCLFRDPVRAFAVLQSIASSGYSVKEVLAATGIFAAALRFVWHERLSIEASSAQERAGLMEYLEAGEREMLAKFEHHLVHILARQTKMLAPNVAACYLFDAAVALFGDRAYLMADDPTLAHIAAIRNELVRQREDWQVHRGTFRGGEEAALSKCEQEESNGCDRADGHDRGKKRLRINTLGRFELEAYDPHIVIKNKVRKQLRLLISLMVVYEGREIGRPQVQRIMWPDAPERNARQSLYNMWSLLNKSVIDRNGSCPFFESYPHSLALNTGLVETDTQLLNELCRRLRTGTLDTQGYERAIEQAEELYRGPLLPGEETAEIIAYRKKYQDRLIEALLESGEHLRKRGETSLALRYFRFAFDNEPTREDVCYQLMLTLWKLGRHGEALDEYFVCRRALIDLFGIEGTAKLRDLYDAILADAS